MPDRFADGDPSNDQPQGWQRRGYNEAILPFITGAICGEWMNT